LTQVVQIGIAILIGVVILALGRWGIRVLATPIPDEPDPEDVMEVERHYRCTVCGLRLTVTHAQGEEVVAPRHCREEMVEEG
jgi:hypothetical protein